MSAYGLFAPPVAAHSSATSTPPHRSAAHATLRPARQRLAAAQSTAAVATAAPAMAPTPAGELTCGSNSDVAVSAAPTRYSTAAPTTAIAPSRRCPPQL